MLFTFIGGSHDGERHELPVARELRLPRVMPAARPSYLDQAKFPALADVEWEVYLLRSLQYVCKDGRIVATSFYVVASLDTDDAYELILDNYRRAAPAIPGATS